MVLYKYVYQLLRTNDCVIIPEFGGFVANYNSAKINFNNQEFFPPSKRIAFNQSLNSNDGLLINHISKFEKLTWQEASKLVSNFVSDLNLQLKNGNVVEFPDLGEFSLNNGSLIFYPFEINKLLDESYGLTVFTFPMLQKERKIIALHNQLNNSPKLSKKQKTKKSSLKPLFYTLSSAAVIAGLLTVSYHLGWFDNKQENINHANIISVEQSNNKTSENNTQQETVELKEIVENVSEDSFVETNIDETEVVEVTTVQSHSVYVIAGSFANLENAENLCNKLISDGFEALVLPSNNNMYRVSLKSFANTETAYSELTDLREQSSNQSLWVLAN